MDFDFGAELLFGSQTTLLHGKEPLETPIVEHGDPARFAPIVALPALRSIEALMRAWDGADGTVRAWSPSRLTSFELVAPRSQLGTLYQAGFTLVFDAAQRFLPELGTMCRALEADLGVAAGKFNAQLFCAQVGGEPRAHFDHDFNISCQLRGEKTWRLQKNEFLRFPRPGISMFLGRPVPAAAMPYVSGPTPRELTNPEVHHVKPGGVVFVPPGVLHETLIHSESMSITFALDQTDCLAVDTARALESRLLLDPALRAPRLGFQYQDIEEEARAISAQLRALADEVDQGKLLRRNPPRYRLREGLRVDAVDSSTVVVRTERVEKKLLLDPDTVTVLCWADKQREFGMGDMMRALVHIDVDSANDCLARLTHVGLVERVAGA